MGALCVLEKYRPTSACTVRAGKLGLKPLAIFNSLPHNPDFKMDWSKILLFGKDLNVFACQKTVLHHDSVSCV